MQRKSFTLVELVIVLVILAILVSVALPTFMGVRKKAYRAEPMQILSEIKTCSWAYNFENGGIPGSKGVWPGSAMALGYTGGLPNTTNWGFNFTTYDGGAFSGCSVICNLGPDKKCLKVVARPLTTGRVPASAGHVALYLDVIW